MAAVELMPSASIENARIDFRLDFLLGAVVAACSVWLWACGVLISDVSVTLVTLKWVNKKRAVAGWSVATAPLRGTQLELPEIIGWRD